MRCSTLSDLPPPPLDQNGWPRTEESLKLPERMSDGRLWPRLSIVIPSFNQVEYLEEAIRSVVHQGYPDLELMVLDGGSTDGSVAVLRKYARFMAHWRSRRDAGQSAAINEGFAAATGVLMGYLNSDDVYRPGTFAAVAQAYVAGGSPRHALLCGMVRDLTESGLGRTHENLRFGSILEWLDGGVSLHQPGCFWTAPLWRKCGPFPQGSHFVFDRFFFTTCRAQRAKFIHIPTVLAWFRHHQLSKTMSSTPEHDYFAAEWDNLKALLEVRLTPTQSLGVVLGRRIRENWCLASAALSSKKGAPPRRLFWRQLLRCPLWFLHRPMLGAARRLLVSDVRSLIDSCADRSQPGGPPAE